MPLKLPPNYLRVLSSLTEIVEREAWELLQLLENPGRQGEVLQTTVSFTPEERKEKMLRLETLLEENLNPSYSHLLVEHLLDQELQQMLEGFG